MIFVSQPYHVNNLNLEPTVANRTDPVSGFAAIPRNMTGIATKLAAAGYRTGAFGKWDAGMATPVCAGRDGLCAHGASHTRTALFFIIPACAFV